MINLFNKIMQASNFTNNTFNQIYIYNTKNNYVYNIKNSLTIEDTKYFKIHPIKKQLKNDAITIYENYIIINSHSYKDYFAICVLSQSIIKLDNYIHELPPCNTMDDFIIKNTFKPILYPIYIIYIKFYTHINENIEEHNEIIFNIFKKEFNESLIDILHQDNNEYILLINTESYQSTIKMINRSIINFRSRKNIIFIPNFYISTLQKDTNLYNTIDKIRSKIIVINNICINHINFN